MVEETTILILERRLEADAELFVTQDQFLLVLGPSSSGPTPKEYSMCFAAEGRPTVSALASLLAASHRRDRRGERQ